MIDALTRRGNLDTETGAEEWAMCGQTYWSDESINQGRQRIASNHQKL